MQICPRPPSSVVFVPRRTLHGEQEANFFAQHQGTSEPIPSPTILLPDSSARRCHHLQPHPSTQAYLQPVQTMVFPSLDQHKSANNPMLPPLQEREMDNHGCVHSGGCAMQEKLAVVSTLKSPVSLYRCSRTPIANHAP